ELAIAAGGIAACALATAAAVLLRRSLVHAEDVDAHLAATKVKLRELIEAEAAERAAELERTLARARADSVSLLAEEERRIAEERRSQFAERRRGLHELDERMRRRERELMEQIEREEGESVQRIRAGFEDVQRRQVESMSRIVERAASTYSDEATQQFAGLVKSSREDAAQRLARELERSVESFAREAESVLAERLAHVGDAAAQ